MDAEQTVDYIMGRVHKRKMEGMDPSDALLDTLAALDEELYSKVLKDGAHTLFPVALEEYLLKHYA